MFKSCRCYPHPKSKPNGPGSDELLCSIFFKPEYHCFFVCLFVCFCFFNADMHWGKSSRIPGKTRIQLAKKWSNFNHLLCLAKHYHLHGVHRVFTRLSSVCGGGDDFNSNKYFNPMTIIFLGMNLGSSSSVFTALCKVNDLQKKGHTRRSKKKTKQQQ